MEKPDDLKAALQAIGMRGSLTRLTPVQLRKKVDKAKAEGKTSLETRSCAAPVDLVESVLKRFESTASSLGSGIVPAAIGSSTMKRKASPLEPGEDALSIDLDPDGTIDVRPLKYSKSTSDHLSLKADTVIEDRVFIEGAGKPDIDQAEKDIHEPVDGGSEDKQVAKVNRDPSAEKVMHPEPADKAIEGTIMTKEECAAKEAERKQKKKEAAEGWPGIEALQAREFPEEEIKAFEKCRLQFIEAKEAWLQSTGGGYLRPSRQERQSIDARKRESDALVESGVSHGIDQSAPADTGSSPQAGRSLSSDLYKPEKLSDELRKDLHGSVIGRTPPRLLYRVSSRSGPNYTNGNDTLVVHEPAAHLNYNERCHDSFYEIPNGFFELGEMVGRRFLWDDRRLDETLSETSSLLFALVHATGRKAKGQLDVKIHVIDVHKAMTMDGGPIEFHFGPDLMRILDIQGWSGWNSWELLKLRQPWYTHEWITHHVVRSVREFSFEVNIDDLIWNDLYQYLPSLETEDETDMRSLYHRCTRVRSIEHRAGYPGRPINATELETARRLASCFRNDEHFHSKDRSEPPLRIFLDFLGLVARPKGEPAFKEWILEKYPANKVTREDLVSMSQATDSRRQAALIANNLPEVSQMLELAREVYEIHGLPALPPKRVWMADPDFNWHGKWLKPHPKSIMIREPRSKKERGPLAKLLEHEADRVSDRHRPAQDTLPASPENVNPSEVDQGNLIVQHSYHPTRRCHPICGR